MPCLVEFCLYKDRGLYVPLFHDVSSIFDYFYIREEFKWEIGFSNVFTKLMPGSSHQRRIIAEKLNEACE